MLKAAASVAAKVPLLQALFTDGSAHQRHPMRLMNSAAAKLRLMKYDSPCGSHRMEVGMNDCRMATCRGECSGCSQAYIQQHVPCLTARWHTLHATRLPIVSDATGLLETNNCKLAGPSVNLTLTGHLFPPWRHGRGAAAGSSAAH